MNIYNDENPNNCYDPNKVNIKELMDFYGYKGKIGEIKLKIRLLRSWILQALASNSPSSNLAVALQKSRGVKIGSNTYIGPNVHIDLLYPEKITIESYVSIGMNSMIFAHSNPTNSALIKKIEYPRKVASVVIKEGSWIAPGCIILLGVTIGPHSVVGARSMVLKDVPPLTVVGGIPAKPLRELKKLTSYLREKTKNITRV